MLVPVIIPNFDTGLELPEYLGYIPDLLLIIALYCVAYTKNIFTNKIWVLCLASVVLYDVIYTIYYFNSYLDRINLNGSFAYILAGSISLVYVPGYIAMVMMCMKENFNASAA